MTTKTIIITALPTGRGGLESSVLAVKRPTTSYSSIVSMPSTPVLFASSANLNSNSSITLPLKQKIEPQFESYDEDDDDDDFDDLMEPPRKRERLTHLSAEEKLFRRKMKNRIAAQTARDRKKAHMGDLEERIRRLETENATLKAENVQLKMKSGKLNEENGRLKIELDENDVSQIVNYEKTNADLVIQQTVEVLGSAASINVPQQKEQTTPSWILNWLLVVLTAMTSSNSCNNSSETAETICKTEALSVAEIRNRIKNLPITNAGKTVLLSKLTELLNMWKATRKKNQTA